MPRTVAGRRICVTDRADLRRRPLKELLLMAIQARLVRWVIGDVRKSSIPGAHVFPILGGKLMAFAALHLVGFLVMRKLGILNFVWHRLSARSPV